MDLIDRYLHAVRRNLPAAKADDIVAELRDDIASRKEDREEARGRALDKAETTALIKEFGHPLVVASRYRSHQYLIGPEVFPFYVFVLRIVLMIVAAVVVAAALVPAVLGEADPLQSFLRGLGGAWGALAFNFAAVTIVFAVLERVGFPADHLRRWTPEHLPAIDDKRQGPWESAIEVALSIAFILWWTGVIHIPYTADAGSFRLEPAPIWTQLYTPILVLASVRLVHNVIQWLRPRWITLRAVIGGATAVGGLALIAIAFRAGHWMDVVATGMPLAEASQLEASLNLALRIALIVIAVIWTLGTLGGAWQFFRARQLQHT
jgi:hypothetical protein